MSIKTENGQIDINGSDIEREPLLILKALAESAEKGRELSACSEAAVFEHKEKLKNCAGEDIYRQICKIITGEFAMPVMLKYPHIILCGMPEIEKSIGFDQRNEHHAYDVWEHTVWALNYIDRDKISRLVMLLHDLGKPHCFSVDEKGVGHFYGHAQKSELLAREFFARSGEDEETAETVCKFVKIHDSDLFSSEKSIKRWLKKLSLDGLMRLVDIKKADNSAQAPKYMNRLEELEETRSKILRIADIQAILD